MLKLCVCAWITCVRHLRLARLRLCNPARTPKCTHARTHSFTTHAHQVDRNWQPGVVSDGQLRRMQLALKLMPPRSLVFLDEASVDLDIIGRQVGRPEHTLSDARARCWCSTCCAHVLFLPGSEADTIRMSHGSPVCLQSKLTRSACKASSRGRID